MQLKSSQRMLIGNPSMFGTVISNVISLEKARTFIPGMLKISHGFEFLKVIIDTTMTESARDVDLTSTLGQLEP
jgi:hypothetical protein